MEYAFSTNNVRGKSTNNAMHRRYDELFVHRCELFATFNYLVFHGIKPGKCETMNAFRVQSENSTFYLTRTFDRICDDFGYDFTKFRHLQEFYHFIYLQELCNFIYLQESYNFIYLQEFCNFVYLPKFCNFIYLQEFYNFIYLRELCNFIYLQEFCNFTVTSVLVILKRVP